MRFATRVDRWMAVMLAVVAAVSCLPMPLARVLARQGPPLWLALLPTAVWILALASILPQWYELRDDGLFLRQGFRKIFIEYGALVEAQPFNHMFSAGAVLSQQRLLLVVESGRRYIIGVAEEDRFLDELAKRCPQLEKRPYGLGLPMSAPSFV